MQNLARKGFVYLMKAADGFYKIGRSINVPRRIHELNRDHPPETYGHPGPYKTVEIFEFDDYVTAEHAMHGLFEPDQLVGEWFRLSKAQVRQIKWKANELRQVVGQFNGVPDTPRIAEEPVSMFDLLGMK